MTKSAIVQALIARSNSLYHKLSPVQQARAIYFIKKINSFNGDHKKFNEWLKQSPKYSRMIPKSGLSFFGDLKGAYHVKLNPKKKDTGLCWFIRNGKAQFYFDNHDPPLYDRLKKFKAAI